MEESQWPSKLSSQFRNEFRTHKEGEANHSDTMSSPKTFLVIRTYVREKDEERASLRTAHLEYQDRFTLREEMPSFKLAFRGLDGKGAWHFVFADNESQVRELIEGDPQRKAKTYTYEIVEVGKLRGSW